MRTLMDNRTERRVELMLQKTGRLVAANPSLRLSLKETGDMCYINYKENYIQLGQMLLERGSRNVGEFLVLAKGALYHELAHWLFSPHKDFQESLTYAERKMFMCAEDCRIETWFALRYKKATDYFYLLYMNLIFDNPGNRLNSMEAEVSRFLLTFGRKYLPGRLLKDVMKLDWVTPALLKKVDEYVQLDLGLSSDRVTAKTILKWLVKFFQKVLPAISRNMMEINNTGADQGQDVEGAPDGEKMRALGSGERGEIKSIVSEGTEQQTKQLEKEAKHEQREEKAKKAKEKIKKEKAEEEGKEEEEDSEEAEGGTADDESEEDSEKEAEGREETADDDAEEGEEEGSEERDKDGGSDGMGGSGAGTGEGKIDDSPKEPEKSETEKLWEQIEEKCVEESIEEISNFKPQPSYHPDRVSPGRDGLRGHMTNEEVGKKALELTKYLKGLESLEIKSIRKKRRGTLDNARIHDYQRTNRIFQKKQLTFGNTINIGILIDTSGSMKVWAKDVIDAARILYRAGSNCKHRVTMRAFASESQLLFQGFFDPNAKFNENTPVIVSGGTNIYKSLADFAVDFSFVKGKKVLFIISDGHISSGFSIGAQKDINPNRISGDYFNEAMNEVKQEFIANEVEVHFIRVDSRSPQKLDRFFPASMEVPYKTSDWFTKPVVEILRKMTVGSL